MKWIRQTSSEPVAYATIASRTLQTQGLSGFMSGSAAAVYRNVPHSVLVYSLYPHAANLTKKSGGREEVFMTRFCAGYITMVGATLVTHPLDTLRVRVSVQPDSATYLQTARRVYTADGVRGLYGGFGATLIGAGPRGAIGFGVFETLKPYLARYYFHEEPFCVEGSVRLPRRAAERVVHLSVRYGATAAAGVRSGITNWKVGRLGRGGVHL